jgi:DNA-binding protein H-NS
MNEINKNVNVIGEKILDHSPSIVTETANKPRKAFAASDLSSLSVEELWVFHGELEATLTAKIGAEVRELERRIDRLNVVIDTNKQAGKSSSKTAHRQPYPPVLAKYRNLMAPFETWSGRGRRPRWLSSQLELGKRLEEFQI